MKEKFIPLVSRSIALPDIREITLSVLRETHRSLHEGEKRRIGFVSGLITSDGPLYWERNMAILDEHACRIRTRTDFPVFSPTDIFTMDHLHRIDEYRLSKNDENGWFHFWRAILQSGYITDIYMTKRWEQSKGSRDEFYTAQRIPIRIHNPA